MSESMEQMAADAVAIARLTDREAMNRVYTRAAELAEIEHRIQDKLEELQRLQDDRNKLAREDLPALFDHLHTDRLGVPGWKADVVLESKVHASIKKEWSEADQEAAFRELERLGGEGLEKCQVVVDFGRGEFDLAAEFVRFISGWNRLAGHQVSIDKSVHWQSLTKFVRDLRRRLVPMNMTALGATVTRECRIVPRS